MITQHYSNGQQSSQTPWGNANCARIINFTDVPVPGIRLGDFIVAVNGVPVVHQSFDVAISLLKAVGVIRLHYVDREEYSALCIKARSLHSDLIC